MRLAWVVLPGRFLAEEVAAITAMRGVYTTPQADRTYSMSTGLQPLLGRPQRAASGSTMSLIHTLSRPCTPHMRFRRP